MGSFLVGLATGISAGVFILTFLVREVVTDHRNEICSGQIFKEETADTIRTFTCKVELKK